VVRVPRLAPVAILLLSSALLSGCSSAPEAAPSASAPPTVTTVVGALRPQAYTDTVHLLQQPAFTTDLPGAGEPLRIPIPPFVGRSSFTDWWTVELNEDTQSIQGQAVLFGEVTGPVVNDPSPLAGGCFWSLSVTWDDLDPNAYRDTPCGVEAPTVSPGVRQLVFPLDITGPWPAGTALHFEFHTQDFARSPGADVNLLTASAAYDSTLTIAGLHLPLDPSLLLKTA
jgi:hypothetical protein